MKRIFKGPWLWIVLSAFAVLLAIQYFAPSDGYDEVKTSTMEKYIAAGTVDVTLTLAAQPAVVDRPGAGRLAAVVEVVEPAPALLHRRGDQREEQQAPQGPGEPGGAWSVEQRGSWGGGDGTTKYGEPQLT